MKLENIELRAVFIPNIVRNKFIPNYRQSFDIIYADGSLHFATCIGTNSQGIPIDQKGNIHPNFLLYDVIKELIEKNLITKSIYNKDYLDLDVNLHFKHVLTSKTKPKLFKKAIKIWYIDKYSIMSDYIIGENDWGELIMNNSASTNRFTYYKENDLISKLLSIGKITNVRLYTTI